MAGGWGASAKMKDFKPSFTRRSAANMQHSLHPASPQLHSTFVKFLHQTEVHCLNTVQKMTSQVSVCLWKYLRWRFKTYHCVQLLDGALVVQDLVSCLYLPEVLKQLFGLLIYAKSQYDCSGMQFKTWVNQHYSWIQRSAWKLNFRELPNLTRSPVTDHKVSK